MSPRYGTSTEDHVGGQGFLVGFPASGAHMGACKSALAGLCPAIPPGQIHSFFFLLPFPFFLFPFPLAMSSVLESYT